MRFLKSSGLVLLLGLSCLPPSAAQFPPAPGTGPGLPETIEAIESARVTTRILYITAHPDDESAAVLTYLARGLHADVALLSITRGEGGQNALGPEQAPQLGLIRTQELLAATRGYGVKLYFTRARDFGYSKTPDETEKIWGVQVLEDMVRVIRSFRPNIVINGWGGVHTGHGHHQVSGLWTPKSVALAADPKAYAELSNEHLEPWTGGLEPVQILDIDRGSDKPNGYVLPLDEVSPLYGKTWREIGLDAFVNHHTQGIAGFLNSPYLRRPIALKREDGQPFDPASLDRKLTDILAPEDCKQHPNSCERLRFAADKILEARKAALQLDWPNVVHLLDQAQKAVDGLIPPGDIVGIPWTPSEIRARSMQGKIFEAILLTAGFQLTAEADRADVVIGEPFNVTVSYRCRDGVDCPVEGPLSSLTGIKGVGDIRGDFRKGQTFVATLSEKEVAERRLNQPVPAIDSAGSACVMLKFSDHGVYYSVRCFPIVHNESSSTQALRLPLRVVPAYTLMVDPKQTVEILQSEHKHFDIFLRVHSYSTKAAKITVGLNVPDGLHASAPVDLSFDGIGDQYAKFTVTPPAKLDPGDFTISAYAKRGDETFSASLEPLSSMPSILWSEPAQCVVHAFDINVPPHLRVGYISAEGEPIPEALKRLGIDVDMLDATALNFGDLSKFDAIVVGVRAYELRPELTGANKRLLDYVVAGGTLVVQYNRDFIWDKLQPAPYPAKIGSPTPRVTDETADVRFLQPNDPLLNSPNKIAAADFNNWVQERGLYYWSVFDPHYTPLLAMHDPGETDLNGSLVYTHYGQGSYIYTGLSFFRQLPEGNSGAYRLFVNLISASRTHQPAATH
ncbi:MAG: PIG-L family deacetylase [Candidatus Acidiferrales bacterium]